MSPCDIDSLPALDHLQLRSPCGHPHPHTEEPSLERLEQDPLHYEFVLQKTGQSDVFLLITCVQLKEDGVNSKQTTVEGREMEKTQRSKHSIHSIAHIKGHDGEPPFVPLRDKSCLMIM